MSCVDLVWIVIERVCEYGYDLVGLLLVSDVFFFFVDGL